MKKFLLSVAALVAFSGLASASQELCTPSNADVVASTPGNPPANVTANISCATVFASGGAHLTSWSLLLNASWQDSANPITQHNLQFFANPSASASGNTTCTTGASGFTGSCQGFGPTVNIFLTNFTTNVTGTAQTLGGLALPANATVTVFLNYFETPDAGVPEPMTMSLMGAGLLALGIAGRKLRKS